LFLRGNNSPCFDRFGIGPRQPFTARRNDYG
jgi:hypothetical protein